MNYDDWKAHEPQPEDDRTLCDTCSDEMHAAIEAGDGNCATCLAEREMEAEPPEHLRPIAQQLAESYAQDLGKLASVKQQMAQLREQRRQLLDSVGQYRDAVQRLGWEDPCDLLHPSWAEKARENLREVLGRRGTK